METESVVGEQLLLLNTRGCCFFCLKVINYINNEQGGEEGSLSFFQNLCHYLQINQKEILTLAGVGVVSKDMKFPAAEDTLRLCQSCGVITSKFAELFQQLEKIQREIISCLKKINDEMSEANRNPELAQDYSHRLAANSVSFGQIKFIDKLRKEISQKISSGTRNRQPRLNQIGSFEDGSDATAAPATTPQEEEGRFPMKTEESFYPQVKIEVPEPPSHSDGEDSSAAISSTPSTPPNFPNSNQNRKSKKKNESSEATPRLRNRGAGKKVPKCIFNPSTEKYECRECQKEFSSKAAVYCHYDSSHTGKIFKCGICNEAQFKRSDQFSHHKSRCREILQKRLEDEQKREADPSYKHSCPYCGKKFRTKSNMTAHLSLVHQNMDEKELQPKHKCDICQKGFKSFGILNEHKAVVHLGKRLSCKICDKKYSNRTAYRKHEKECVKKNPNHPSLIQNVEEEKTKTNKKKRNKMLPVPKKADKLCFVQNTATGTFDCNACKKSFPTAGSVQIHYGMRHIQKSFQCDLCGTFFASVHTLKFHRERRCTGNVKCKTKEKKVALLKSRNQRRLEDMMRRDNDPRHKFPCLTCGLKFIKHYSLIQHQRLVHDNETKFECDICGKKVKTKVSLRKHKEVIHFGKSFKCGSCGKEYKSKMGKIGHEKQCIININIKKEKAAEKTE